MSVTWLIIRIKWIRGKNKKGILITSCATVASLSSSSRRLTVRMARAASGEDDIRGCYGRHGIRVQMMIDCKLRVACLGNQNSSRQKQGGPNKKKKQRFFFSRSHSHDSWTLSNADWLMMNQLFLCTYFGVRPRVLSFSF